MTANIQALVDAFATRTNQQDYNIAEDINNLQTALKTLAYATLAQSDFANTETLAATKTLTDDSPTLQFLNPNSADRDVSLPALAVTNKPFLIMNTNGSTYLLTVKNAGGTVIRVIPASKMYLFVSDGNQWVCVGFDLYKTLTPSAISANQNDYNPTGNYEADILRISSTAAYSITGLVGGSTNRIKIIKNVGSYPITLSDENASSTAANRFALANDLVVEPDAMVMLVYDPTASRWSAIGGGSSSSSGSLAISIASVTGSSVTGVEETHHVLDVSGMTANQDFNLPTPSAAGKRIKVTLSTGDSTYALIVKANSVELTRIFISNETLEYISTGTGAANWQLIQDNRICSKGIMERQTAQSINSATDTKIQTATIISNVGDVCDNATNYRVTCRRAGLYSIKGYIALAGALDDQEGSLAEIFINGVVNRYVQTFVSSSSGDRQGTAEIVYEKNLSVGDYVELYVFHNEGAAVNTNTTTYPQLSVIEILQ